MAVLQSSQLTFWEVEKKKPQKPGEIFKVTTRKLIPSNGWFTFMMELTHSLQADCGLCFDCSRNHLDNSNCSRSYKKKTKKKRRTQTRAWLIGFGLYEPFHFITFKDKPKADTWDRERTSQRPKIPSVVLPLWHAIHESSEKYNEGASWYRVQQLMTDILGCMINTQLWHP